MTDFDKDSYQTPTACPKCGGELSDHWDGEAVSAFVGEWSDDRFRCEGHKVVEFVGFSRTKSCGYFGLADFWREQAVGGISWQADFEPFRRLDYVLVCRWLKPILGLVRYRLDKLSDSPMNVV